VFAADFIRLGLGILDPIQVGAAGITPRRSFRLSFLGTIDEVELLPHATPGQAYEAIQDAIAVLGETMATPFRPLTRCSV